MNKLRSKNKYIKFSKNTPRLGLQDKNDMRILSSFVITTFNVFIEYFPYKHIMEEIYAFCNIDINDPVFVHAGLDLVYPNTDELEGKYNYYDTPDLYIENVSTTIKNQPALVIMIGAPGIIIYIITWYQNINLCF